MTPIIASVRCVAPVKAILGEGPVFDPRNGKLIFLDIKGGKLFVYNPQTEETETLEAPGMVSALGLRRAGGYICARKDGFARLAIADGKVKIEGIVDPEADRPANRFNDGKVDPSGGFWAGTMDDTQSDDRAGAWWRLSSERAVCRLDDGFHVTNGPAFDADRGRVYFTDSARRVIFIATSDGEGIRDKEVFLRFGESDGYPDGMDIDAGGNLWIAFWDGAAIRRFSPEGDTIDDIAIPAPRPTSIALAGDRAFITTARIGLSAEQKSAFPLSGGLFELQLAAPVVAPTRYFEG